MLDDMHSFALPRRCYYRKTTIAKIYFYFAIVLQLDLNIFSWFIYSEKQKLIVPSATEFYNVCMEPS